jgi:polar amino acid transport system substrate-binding protein
MTIWNRLAKLLPVAAIAATILAATAPLAQAQSVIEEIKQRGTMRVGISTFVPWAMRDKAGELIGFEVDIAKKIAEDMGVEIEFVPTAWSGIIPSLLAKKFDVIISGMTITPERNLTVNFSNTLVHTEQQMAANIAMAGDFKKIEDFNKAEITITCRRGATSCIAAQRNFPQAQLRQFEDDAQAFQEVVNGNAHAMISSAPKPRFWTDANPDKIFLPFETELARESEGIVVRKGDYDAINFFNNWIVINENNGWIKDRQDYWFKNQSAWKDMVATD